MTWMHPDYVKMDGFRDVGSCSSRYNLYLYKDREFDSSNELKGVPALFIHGNAGSYQQVRSIAKETDAEFARLVATSNANNHLPLDIFALDLNGELSAFSGHVLARQSACAYEAVQFILNLYRDTAILRSTRPPVKPDSVIILAHSMGGIAARRMFSLPNFQSGSVTTIITMATPHLYPPIVLDGEIQSLYKSMNNLWKNDGSNAAFNELFYNVTMVSIVGGNQDTHVPSHLCHVESLIPPENGFTVYTSTVLTVWTMTDHLSILWCNQLVKVIARTLIEITDSRKPGGVMLSDARMKTYRASFLGQMSSEDSTWTIPFARSTLHNTSSMTLGADQTSDSGRLHLLPVSGVQKISAYATIVPSDFNWRIYLCRHSTNESPTLSCRDTRNSHTLMPLYEPQQRHAPQVETESLPRAAYLTLSAGYTTGWEYIAVDCRDSASCAGRTIVETATTGEVVLDGSILRKCP
ncbi:PGAP1-domain-containing protein [Gonapodya prolifera JEL478]|uniref:GPI inositol-deacylase n=1 Tax=Gonapodya prolifera (strain JEL478) TaxID=1344416 RepID=A0A139A4S4_GONPJ|nr:PGAP1-domain-containing protein [Gonapodya prolifera JEL478]|eukprot:KXS11649.1 PGAP1-domain-containing protein [Gonapodya prolifera JEL478]